MMVVALAPVLAPSAGGSPCACCTYITCACPATHLQVPPALAARLRADLELLLAKCDSVYRSSPSAEASVYTGSAGVALLHLHAATTVFADDEAKRSSHLQQALSLLTPSLHHLRSRDKTFLCGAAGPLAVAAVTEAALGKGREARVRRGRSLRKGG